jgi:hypothetical protein
MIPFNAALVGAYWERRLVLRSEQRRVAGREPPSEQRLEVQPGFLEESRGHLRRQRALITATRPTDLLFTGIPPTDIQATRSRATDIQATRDTPLSPVLRAMDTQVLRVSPVTQPIPVHRAMATEVARYILSIPVLVMEIPWLVIPEIGLRRTGRREPSTLSAY